MPTRTACERRSSGAAATPQPRVDRFLELDGERLELLQRVEAARAERNAAARAIAEAKGRGEDAAAEIARQSELKQSQSESEAALARSRGGDRTRSCSRCPNLPAPVRAARRHRGGRRGRARARQPAGVRRSSRKDHLDLAGPDGLGLIDTEAAGRVSGSRFHYLLGDLVRLEFALVQWGLAKLHARGFTPVIPPVLVKREAMDGTGFFPEAEAQVYALSSDEPVPRRHGRGAARVAARRRHARRAEDLPLHYVGFSSCFRREAGAAGKDTRGIFRVHQFDKLELFSYCHPDRSWEEQEALLAIEEEIAQELGFHYQVVNVPAGDLGASAARKFDIEVWLPGQGRYRELTSCSNCTDYQARRLNTRFRGDGGKPQFVHMLNGTAITSSRTLLALIEYGQREDGSIAPQPPSLHPFGRRP